MFIAAFDPGQEMAFANFFLAIFCLFTFSLPLLLITRGEKTEANRNFITATINPWSQIGKETELTPVVISGIAPTIELQSEVEVIYENDDDKITESKVVISIDNDIAEESIESSHQLLATNDEVLAA